MKDSHSAVKISHGVSEILTSNMKKFVGCGRERRMLYIHTSFLLRITRELCSANDIKYVVILLSKQRLNVAPIYENINIGFVLFLRN